MNLISIDEQKCNRDWFCVNECPAKILVVKDRNEPPALVEGAEELCIYCGHCVAVCPHEALSLRDQRPGDLSRVRLDLLPNYEQVDHFLRARRSIRTYKDRPVNRETIQETLETAAYAPSGHNWQPVNWIVFYETEEVRELAALTIDWMRSMIDSGAQVAQTMRFDRVVADWESGNDRIMRGAPHLIMAYGQKDFPPAETASIIAVTYLELAVCAKGLGACWAGYFNAAANNFEPMKERLKLGEGHRPYAALLIGYPKYKYRRIPLRNKPEISWR
jgi:nitroreductase/NAD-dependent dihydropyrimidine dehydrogenase PreA subunit